MIYTKNEKNDVKSTWENENRQREYENHVQARQILEINAQNQKTHYGYQGQLMNKSKSMAQIKIVKGQSEIQKNIRGKQANDPENDKIISNSQKQGIKNVILIQSSQNLLNPHLNRITESSTVTQTKSRQQKNCNPIRSSLDQDKHDFYPTPSSSLVTQENQAFIQQYYPSSFIGSEDDRMVIGSGSTPSRQTNHQQVHIYPNNSNKDQFKQYNIKGRQTIDQFSDIERYSPNTQRVAVKNNAALQNNANIGIVKNYQNSEFWTESAAQRENQQNNLIFRKNVFNQYEKSDQRQDTARLGVNEFEMAVKNQKKENRYDENQKEYQNQNKMVKQSHSQRENISGKDLKNQYSQKPQSQLKFQKIKHQNANNKNFGQKNLLNAEQKYQQNETNLQSPTNQASNYQNYIERQQPAISENIQPILAQNNHYHQINQVKVAQKNYLLDQPQEIADKKFNLNKFISSKEPRKTFIIEQKILMQKVQDSSEIMSPPLQYSSQVTNFQSKIQSSIKETKYRIELQEQQNLLIRAQQLGKKQQLNNLKHEEQSNLLSNRNEQVNQYQKVQQSSSNQKSQVQPNQINTLNQYSKNSQVPSNSGFSTAVASNKLQQQKLYKIPEKHSSSQKKLLIQYVNKNQQQKIQIQRNVAVSLQPSNGAIMKQYISKVAQKQQMQPNAHTGNKKIKKTESSATLQKQRKTYAVGKQNEVDSNSEQFSNQVQQNDYEKVSNTDKQYINKQKQEVFSNQESYRTMMQKNSPKEGKNAFKDQFKNKYDGLPNNMKLLQVQEEVLAHQQMYVNGMQKSPQIYSQQVRSQYDPQSPEQQFEERNQCKFNEGKQIQQKVENLQNIKIANYQQNIQFFERQKEEVKTKRQISKYESQEQFNLNNNVTPIINYHDNRVPKEDKNQKKMYSMGQSQSTAIIAVNQSQKQKNLIFDQQNIQVSGEHQKVQITYRDQHLPNNRIENNYKQIHKRQISYQIQNQPQKQQILENKEKEKKQKEMSRFKNKQIDMHDNRNEIEQNMNMIYSNASSNDDSFSIQYIAQSRENNSNNKKIQDQQKIYKGKFLKLNIDEISDLNFDFNNGKVDQIHMTIGSQSSSKYDQIKNDSASAKSCHTRMDNNQIVTFVNKSGSLFIDKTQNKQTLQTIPSEISISGQHPEKGEQIVKMKKKEMEQSRKINSNLINQWSQSHDILPSKDSIIGLKRVKQQMQEADKNTVYYQNYQKQEQTNRVSVGSSNKQLETQNSRKTDKLSQNIENLQHFQDYNNPQIFQYQDLKSQQIKRNSFLQVQQKALSSDLRFEQINLNKKKVQEEKYKQLINEQKNKLFMEQYDYYSSASSQNLNIKQKEINSNSSYNSNADGQQDKNYKDFIKNKKRQNLNIITENGEHKKHISDLSDINGHSKRSFSNEKIDIKKQGRLLERASQRRGQACDGIYSIKNQQSHALLKIGGEALLSAQDYKSDQLTASIHNKNHHDSRISFVPSMTPIFNDFDGHSDNQNSQQSYKVQKVLKFSNEMQKQINNQQIQKQPQNLKKDKQRVSESMVPSIGELKIQMANQNAKEKSKGISSDIFETMEQEMKQIMNLFAKERKSRKRDISRLQAQLDDKQNQIDQERKMHSVEKNKIIKKWRIDTKRHEEFQEFMQQKVKDTEQELQRLKDKYEPVEKKYKSIGSLSQNHNQISTSKFANQQNIQISPKRLNIESRSAQKTKLRQIQAANQVAQIRIRGASDSLRKDYTNIADLEKELSQLKSENIQQKQIIENLKNNESKKSKSDSKSFNSYNKQDANKQFNVDNLKIDEINYENESQKLIVTPSIFRKNQVKTKNTNSEIVTPKLLLNLECLKKSKIKVSNSIIESEDNSKIFKSYQESRNNQQIVSRVNEEFLNVQQSQKIFGDVDSIRNIKLDSQKINFRKQKSNPFTNDNQYQAITESEAHINESERNNYENKISQLMMQIQQMSGELSNVKQVQQFYKFNEASDMFKQKEQDQNESLQIQTIQKNEQNEINLINIQNNNASNESSIQSQQINQNQQVPDEYLQSENQIMQQKTDKKQERPFINPLNLDQIINQANNFSLNLEELEAKIKQIDQIQIQNALMNSYLSQSLMNQQFSQTEQNSGILSRATDNNQSQIQYTTYNGGSLLQGVQCGTDTQSLETILELRDHDLMGNFNRAIISYNDVLPGTDTANSQLEIRDLRQYNNSSTLSNFILPQTTYRTNRTNLSFRSGNGYGLIIGTNVKNDGGGTLRGGQIQSNAGFSATNGILAAIPQHYQNMTLNGINEEKNIIQQANQRQFNNFMSQQQTAHSARGLIYQQNDLRENNNNNLQINHQNSINSSLTNGNQNLQNQLNINIHKSNNQINQSLLGNTQEPSNNVVDTEAISIIFDELQQSKKQVNEIIEWIQKLKEQNEDKNDDHAEPDQSNKSINYPQSNIQK